MEAVVKYEREGVTAVAEYAIDREREENSKFSPKVHKSEAVFAIEKATFCVPGVNAIWRAKNIISVDVTVITLLFLLRTKRHKQLAPQSFATGVHCCP